MWTQFWDMHSGGRQKLEWSQIFIEAPEKEAVAVFEKRFCRNPHHVTCNCCGDDYSVQEHKTLEQATGYERNCAWDNDLNEYIEEQDPRDMEIRRKCGTSWSDPWGLYIELKDYILKPEVKIIRAEEISEEDLQHLFDEEEERIDREDSYYEEY